MKNAHPVTHLFSGRPTKWMGDFRIFRTTKGLNLCILKFLSPNLCIFRLQYLLRILIRGPIINMEKIQGAVSIRKTVLPGMAIPMLKIRRPSGRLIFNMEITIRR